MLESAENYRILKYHSGNKIKKYDGPGMWHALWMRRKVHIDFWWGNPREGQFLEDPGVHGRII
jgi:hypothetical protein